MTTEHESEGPGHASIRQREASQLWSLQLAGLIAVHSHLRDPGPGCPAPSVPPGGSAAATPRHATPRHATVLSEKDNAYSLQDIWPSTLLAGQAGLEHPLRMRSPLPDSSSTKQHTASSQQPAQGRRRQGGSSEGIK